jgi:Leucine-rich repeat (LRR) protein
VHTGGWLASRRDNTSLCEFRGVQCASDERTLTGLALDYNNLTGTLPSELNLPWLSSLDLTGNRLTGDLPPWLGSLTTLTELYLGGNLFTGTVPNLERLQHLLYLCVRQPAAA